MARQPPEIADRLELRAYDQVPDDLHRGTGGGMLHAARAGFVPIGMACATAASWLNSDYMSLFEPNAPWTGCIES